MTRSILVIDDEPDTCANLRDILTEYGYRVDTAHEGERALELARQHTYDVALLDFKMPGMDGVELLRQLRATNTRTVGVMLTAYANAQTSSSAKAAGAWNIHAKPVDVAKLLADLNLAIASAN